MDVPQPSAGPAQEQISDTVVLRREFGSNWRWWAWFRAQWSATSLTVLGGVIVVIGGWAITMQTRVTVLETKVVPVLEERDTQAEDHADIADLKNRVIRIEDNWDDATKQAGTPPVPSAHKRK